jgi:parallel beta-helix repeat protein
MDDWASGCTVQGNLIVNNVVGGVNMHGGWDNLIENNIFYHLRHSMVIKEGAAGVGDSVRKLFK